MRSAAVLLAVFFLLSCSASLWPNDYADTAVWHSFGFLAVALMWLAVARKPREERLGWALVAGGLLLWVAGDLAWDIVSWNAPLPDVSIVDLFYLSGYLFLMAGVVTMTRRVTGALPSDAVLDGSIVSIAVGLVFWVSLIEPALDPGGVVEVAVAAAYPIAAVVLFATLAWMRFHPQRSSLEPGIALLGAGLFLLVVLEPLSAWYYYEAPNLDIESNIDRVFQFSYALMVLAAHRTGERAAAADDTDGLHPVRFVLLGAALAAGPLTLLLVSGVRSPALAASAAISALVLVRFVSITRDRERARAELQLIAAHDPLTGLANRRTLTDFAETLPADAGLDLVYLDVDHFKQINDVHGHAAGDSLLRQLSHRLQDSLGVTDLGVRLGGDEFVAVCAFGTGVAVAERLATRARSPFELVDTWIDVSLSIGVASTEPGEDLDLDGLLQKADAALYQAKRAGRGRIVRFDSGVDVWLDAQRALESELRAAMSDDRLELRFLPVVTAETGEEVGHEAVFVLEQPDGAITLDLDESLVERAGLAASLSADMVRALVSRDESGPWFVRTPLALLRSIEFLDAALSDGQERRADSLVFEVHEAELVTILRNHAPVLPMLQRAGVRFALVGFGGAGSTLTGAHELPVDFVRLDTTHDQLPDDVLESLRGLVAAMGLEAVTTAEPAIVALRGLAAA